MKPQRQKNKTLKLKQRLKVANENYSVGLFITKKPKFLCTCVCMTSKNMKP